MGHVRSQGAQPPAQLLGGGQIYVGRGEGQVGRLLRYESEKPGSVTAKAGGALHTAQVCHW